MSDASGDIIIKGGSVNLFFDREMFELDPSDPRKHSSSMKKIKRIKIEDETGHMVYDSGDNPDGLKWTIKVVCKDSLS